VGAQRRRCHVAAVDGHDLHPHAVARGVTAATSWAAPGRPDEGASALAEYLRWKESGPRASEGRAAWRGPTRPGGAARDCRNEPPEAQGMATAAASGRAGAARVARGPVGCPGRRGPQRVGGSRRNVVGPRVAWEALAAKAVSASLVRIAGGSPATWVFAPATGAAARRCRRSWGRRGAGVRGSPPTQPLGRRPVRGSRRPGNTVLVKR
jgi:hypothetical protein